MVHDTLQVPAGGQVTLTGWVSRRRDLGSIVFIDLRDRTGIIQLVFDAEKGTPKAVLERAGQLRSEYVIAVKGTVVQRDETVVNPKIETGHIELSVQELEILNASKTPPFYIEDGIEVDEAVRLRYRYLDLRRPEMQQMLKLRHQVARAMRRYLDEHGFLEVETPMLTRSTPEGARDYLVPSRLQPGEFYALPQSPQLFKQLLMVAGVERYYQMARCFRDEDLRADRQPEFTQFDIEQSFIPKETFQSMMEEMMVEVFRDVLGVNLATPFLRLSYQEAMERYGSDKPDIRFGLELTDLGDLVTETEFRVFRDALAAGGGVKAVRAPGCATWSRKQLDEWNQFVASYGLRGLATIALTEGGVKSSIAKFFTEDELRALASRAGAETGDLVFIAAGPRQVVLPALGAVRSRLGADLKLAKDGFHFLWVVDFPLLEYDEEEGRYVAMHHPFTMPKWEDLPLLADNPLAVRAEAYDLVLNGFEVAGGSMRIYRREIQNQMFERLGFSPEEAYEKFGFLLDAFEYGTPPHGGIAFGFDRLVMIMGGRKSLRDCIAFPKTSSGTDLLTGAPGDVSPEQLAVLGLDLAERVRSAKSLV
ncbi:MAG: aspartate--tRNA ligase [Alicyclobacillus herbarius]|uniref:aspartate--tRNA ligase n=1 Tax=Alicyclobacillus herbarius TaxID=122960 RepID=UPI0023524BDA|nr:aspartate--tRNA ligase [Alicyclobacillus herbarius]MCL6631037.1 aspartate--tRNA ligase [Alicyclobacillus herbarius]